MHKKLIWIITFVESKISSSEIQSKCKYECPLYFTKYLSSFFHNMVSMFFLKQLLDRKLLLAKLLPLLPALLSVLCLHQGFNHFHNIYLKNGTFFLVINVSCGFCQYFVAPQNHRNLRLIILIKNLMSIRSFLIRFYINFELFNKF